ncbi:MAG: hypothetical protein AABX02_03375, partial [archaeon]
MNAQKIALFYLGLLLFSPLTAAVPHDPVSPPSFLATESIPGMETPAVTPTPSMDSPSDGEQDIVISFQALPGGGGVCRLSSLTPEEVQRLRDTVLIPGLDAEELSSGTNPNVDRDKVSDSNILLVPNPLDSETAFQKEVPNKIIQPNELSSLQNQKVKGPFAFGISLYDSLRAAKCVDKQCAIEGTNLQLRNSGTGIVGNVKDIYQAMTKDLESNTSEFSDDEKAFLSAQIKTDQLINAPDANTFPVEGLERIPTIDAMNHIRVDNQWDAGILTNCDKGDCVITLYSLFDKYFNSWFSGQMVLSTFGPTAWGQFKKMLKLGPRQNLIGQSMIDKLGKLNVLKDGSIALKNGKGVPYAPSDFFASSVKGIKGDAYLLNVRKEFEEQTPDTFKFFSKSFGQREILSSGGYPNVMTEAFSEKGAFGSLTDIAKREKVFANWGQVKKYTDYVKGMDGAYRTQLESAEKKIAEGLKLGNKALEAEGRNLKRETARGYIKIFKDNDDVFSLDMIDYMRKEANTKMSTTYLLDSSTGRHISLGNDPDKYIANINKSFTDTGDFRAVTNVSRNANGSLKVFELQPRRNVGPLDITKIKSNSYPPDTYVEIPGSAPVLANLENLAQIEAAQTAAKGSPLSLVTADYVEIPEGLSPNAYSDLVLAGSPSAIIPGKLGTVSRHVDTVYDRMVVENYGGGPYTNLLSRSFQFQKDLISEYAKVWTPSSGNGFLQTGKMYGYYLLTRGGNVFDNATLYQLPDEWSEVRFKPKDSEFYNDAYWDIFANEGSDTGDIFQNVISSLPVAAVIGYVSEKNDTSSTVWNWINGTQGRREPDNVAMYLFGASSCPNCQATIQSPTPDSFNIGYLSPESLSTFYIEHVKTKAAKDQGGQILTTFAHHANVEGRLNGTTLEPIDLLKERKNENTCEQVIGSIPILGGVSRVIGAEKIGGLLGGIESVSYLFGGLSGGIVTVINQLAFANKMGECTDDKEGYYASIYIPPDTPDPKGGEPVSKANDLEKNVSEKALDGIRQFAERIDQNHNNQSLTDKALHEATTKINEFVAKAAKSRVAVADLRVTGSSSGFMRSAEITYFWGGPDSLIEPTTYSTDGKTVLTTEDGHTITLSNEDGTLTVDGQVVIDAAEADHVRLSNKNLSIPAIEIPQRLNGFELGDTNSLLFSVNIRGEAVVQDARLLDCIQQAVFEQSGVPLNSNNMSEAFGLTESIATNAYPNIAVDFAHNRILLGGQLPQSAQGIGASINVYGDRRVLVTGAANTEAGLFQSGSWQHGTLVYKPETREILIWLRHHAAAIVSDQDVKNF